MCADPHTVHTIQTTRRKTDTHSRPAYSRRVTQPDLCPLSLWSPAPQGGPEHPPACLPAIGRWDIHTASLQMPSWALRQKTNTSQVFWTSGLQTERDGVGRQGDAGGTAHTQAPGHWSRAVMQEGPHPSRIAHSSPLSYKNSFSQSLSFQG